MDWNFREKCTVANYFHDLLHIQVNILESTYPLNQSLYTPQPFTLDQLLWIDTQSLHRGSQCGRIDTRETTLGMSNNDYTPDSKQVDASSKRTDEIIIC